MSFKIINQNVVISSVRAVMISFSICQSNDIGMIILVYLS